jgi:hypothetical protein
MEYEYLLSLTLILASYYLYLKFTLYYLLYSTLTTSVLRQVFVVSCIEKV